MHAIRQAAILLAGSIGLALASATAAAAEPGFYVGASAGWSFVHASGRTQVASQPVAFGLDDGAFASKGYAGVQILPWVGVEGGYVDLGTLNDSTPGTDVSATSHGWDGFVVGSLPITFVDLFAKVGYISYDANLTATTANGRSRISSSGDGLAYGAGIVLNVDHVAVRAEAERFRMNELDDPYMVSVGVALRF